MQEELVHLLLFICILCMVKVLSFWVAGPLLKQNGYSPLRAFR